MTEDSGKIYVPSDEVITDPDFEYCDWDDGLSSNGN